jgi:stringent starvation protein B
MAKERSTKPYLIRAIYEWCSDSNLTPYLSVKVDAQTRVPPDYVKDGEIVLNISADAAHRLTIGDDAIQFAARFGGVSRECSVPIPAVLGIFARENSQGLFFQAESSSSESATGASASGQAESPAPAPGAKRKLQLVK